MSPSFARRLPALFCAALLALAALPIRPVAEIGMNDDFSYIHTALTLARTGHIVYVGWASAMIGWQLALGALFAHLFGPSFTAVRMSNLAVGVVTAFLLQRTLSRAGVNPWNSTLGTLAVVLSPLALASTFSFMTDLGGLFCIVLCLYSCLRALQSPTLRGALLWLTFAALSNVVGGTVRQIVWLGVLVMVPATLWLLPRRSPVLVTGAALGVVSIASIDGCIVWLRRQPYMLPEQLVFGTVDRQVLVHLLQQSVLMLLDLALLLLPLLLAFLANLPRRAKGFVVVSACIAAVFTLLLQHVHAGLWLPPFLGNDLTNHGAIDATPLHSERPPVLGRPLRVLLSVGTFSVLFGFLYALGRPGMAPAPTGRDGASGAPPVPAPRELAILLGPFLLAYFVLLTPRGAFFAIFDRYLLIPLALLTVAVLRLYQDRIAPCLPRVSVALIVVFALYGVASMHDVFSMYRARARAVEQLRQHGVPATAIDGGFEYNGWTEIERTGYLDSPEIVVPRGAYIPHPKLPPWTPCHTQLGTLVPHVLPRYGLSYTAQACGGPAGLPPVPYSDWLSRRPQSIYTIHLP